MDVTPNSLYITCCMNLWSRKPQNRLLRTINLAFPLGLRMRSLTTVNFAEIPMSVVRYAMVRLRGVCILRTSLADRALYALGSINTLGRCASSPSTN